MNQYQTADQRAQYRANVESLQVFRWAHQSHASRKLGGPPPRADAWGRCVEWLAKLAQHGDVFAQVVAAIGLPPLYQTDGEAAAWVYRQAEAVLAANYDDVIRRAAPEGYRHSECQRPFTLREKITVMVHVKRAVSGFDCCAPGYGWALEALAIEECVALPNW